MKLLGTIHGEFHEYVGGKTLVSFDVTNVEEGQLVWLLGYIGLKMSDEARALLVGVLEGEVALPDSVELTPS